MADPGVVTVGVTREDGTVLVAAGTATAGSGTAPRTFNLTAAQNVSLDFLRLDWVSATLGTITTYVEIVGGFLTTIPALRALKPLDNPAVYLTADLIDARTAAETALEDACGVAFVPRYFRERLDGSGGQDVLLDHVRPLTVTAATVDGSVVDASELELYRDGRVYRPGGWSRGRRNVELKGTAGYAFPPPRVGLAVQKLVKQILIQNPISDRAVSFQTDDGVVQYFLNEGVRGLCFSIPEAQVCVNEYAVSRVSVA